MPFLWWGVGGSGWALDGVMWKSMLEGMEFEWLVLLAVKWDVVGLVVGW
jgi:hypothetical protein